MLIKNVYGTDGAELKQDKRNKTKVEGGIIKSPRGRACPGQRSGGE